MFSAKQFLRASEPLADTVVLELVDDVIDGQEWHVDDVILTLRFPDTVSTRAFQNDRSHSTVSVYTEATGAPISESGKALGHT